MDGLVVVDTEQNLLRSSIIRCDSRAIEFGKQVFKLSSSSTCLDTHLTLQAIHKNFQQIITQNKPLILFDRTDEKLNVSRVVLDDHKAGYTAVIHLIDRGYEKTAFLTTKHGIAFSLNARRARRMPCGRLE